MKTVAETAKVVCGPGDFRPISYRCLSVLFYEGNIAAFHEGFAIDKLSPDLPDIYILFHQLLTVIAVPAYTDIIALEEKHSLAVEYL